MRRFFGYGLGVVVLLLTFALGGCGSTALTPAEQGTATAVAKLATFQALPDADKQATQASVFATINAGLNNPVATP
jgi:hypothetical protein